MENSTDALIMAGSVLLLIIALTVTISSLTNLRFQTQELLDSRDQLLITKDTEGEYINYLKSGNDSDSTRIVGIETVITAIRRMIKEDYVIFIKPSDATQYSLGSSYDDLKVKIDHNNNSIKLSISGTSNKYVSKEKLKELLYLVYDQFKEAQFDEYTGIYQNKTSEGVSQANKSTYKIITYKQK